MDYAVISDLSLLINAKLVDIWMDSSNYIFMSLSSQYLPGARPRASFPCAGHACQVFPQCGI